MLYNLLKWDAYANYEVLETAKTFEQCVASRDCQPEDKRWHEYEITRYIPLDRRPEHFYNTQI